MYFCFFMFQIKRYYWNVISSITLMWQNVKSNCIAKIQRNRFRCLVTIIIAAFVTLPVSNSTLRFTKFIAIVIAGVYTNGDTPRFIPSPYAGLFFCVKCIKFLSMTSDIFGRNIIIQHAQVFFLSVAKNVLEGNASRLSGGIGIP